MREYITIFNELTDRLSIVPRWNIIHTIQKQSVAEHSYNVAVLTRGIAHWLEWSPTKSMDAVSMALDHDKYEGVMGDPPSPIKEFVDETALATKYYLLFPHFPVDPVNYRHCHLVVKIADILEAWLFCTREMGMGNHSIHPVRIQLYNKITAALKTSENELGVPEGKLAGYIAKLMAEAKEWSTGVNPHKEIGE